jgi:hypothetical protein
LHEPAEAMKRKLSAQELELRSAAANPPRISSTTLPAGEAMAMLARRGLHPEKTVGDVPFPQPFDGPAADRLSEWLGHYAFRLFLRGAIQTSSGFLPADTTRYLTKAQSTQYAETLVDLGLAERNDRGRYSLQWPARSFGGTLEWYVGRELERRYGFDVATGVKMHVRGVGGDLDVVAAAEGKLVYIELKSSPPKNLAASEIAAFCDRLRLLRPDVSLFVVDTALRLSDKVLPMLVRELRNRGFGDSGPRRIASQLWALTPRVYAVNGSRDLMANIGKAIAAGFLALSDF